jgi:hypothetical protein
MIVKLETLNVNIYPLVEKNGIKLDRSKYSEDELYTILMRTTEDNRHQLHYIDPRFKLDEKTVKQNKEVCGKFKIVLDDQIYSESLKHYVLCVILFVKDFKREAEERITKILNRLGIDFSRAARSLAFKGILLENIQQLNNCQYSYHEGKFYKKLCIEDQLITSAALDQLLLRRTINNLF